MQKTLSLRSQCAHWLWQSVSPVPKGSPCQGELSAVRLTEGSPSTAPLVTQKRRGVVTPPYIISAPLPKGGWHGKAVTGGFFPARTRSRLPRTESLHQPSVGPPPFRQGRQRISWSAVVRGDVGIAPLRSPIENPCVGADAHIGPVVPHFLLSVGRRGPVAVPKISALPYGGRLKF